MSLGQETLARDVRVRVTNIDTHRIGVISVMLYGEDGYPRDHGKALSIQSKQADTPTLEFTFSINLEVFAIKVLHDEDMNNEVSKDWTGIFPSEGLGFSNGATLSFGPPSFRRSKLVLAETGDVIEIPVIYP